ncbi:hypothetical protein C2845_PM06G08690 [Panicum miliaceum]|uniref:RRM domain-containing protein n=1 Tax=Panicum miliaceum TaxID=4540 RepID=A0A3L6R9G6_PANMI|nr:hypothetical protein C2845_PM06G08690 [Panicum miliaceum]
MAHLQVRWNSFGREPALAGRKAFPARSARVPSSTAPRLLSKARLQILPTVRSVTHQRQYTTTSVPFHDPSRRLRRLRPDPDMPRYDDRYGGTRLYVGRLASRTRSRDLEYLFSRYGRFFGFYREVCGGRVPLVDLVTMEFSDPRDADDARYNLDGRDVDGSRITVEFAKGA